MGSLKRLGHPDVTLRAGAFQLWCLGNIVLVLAAQPHFFAITLAYVAGAREKGKKTLKRCIFERFLVLLLTRF